MTRRYSIGAFAAKYERAGMRFIDFFSLPSDERRIYYTGIDSSIPVFILPNYPSLKVYPKPGKKNSPDGYISIIYQGFIGKGHSIEELIRLLQEDIDGSALKLILKGSVTTEYKSLIDKLAKDLDVADQLIWIDIGPYYELPALTASCDIGIGINMNTDIVSKTQGTASNKVYEYAASELPVILYDSEQFTKYLKKYDWAFFTDGSLSSLRKNVELIIKDLPHLGQAARSDFEATLNFENYFIPAFTKVTATTR